MLQILSTVALISMIIGYILTIRKHWAGWIFCLITAGAWIWYSIASGQITFLLSRLIGVGFILYGMYTWRRQKIKREELLNTIETKNKQELINYIKELT